jgi:hypothetical protein
MSMMDAIKKQLGSVLKDIDKEFDRRAREPERSEIISEERAFTEDLAQLDREEPGWDRDARFAAAQGARRAGMTSQLVSNIFGEEGEEEDENPYEGASWGKAENWHCIRCGSVLREVAKDDPAHGKACWNEMQRNGVLHYLCSNKECCHYNAPLILHHPIGGYQSPAGESYSISWVR